jgi:hypothetical protein
MLRPGRGGGGGSLPTSYGGGNDNMSIPQGYGGFNSNNSNGSTGPAYGGYSGGNSGGYSNHNTGSSSSGAAYGGYSNHANTDFKEKAGRKQRRGGSGGMSPLTTILEKLGQPWIIFLIVSILLAIVAFHYRSQYNAVLKILEVKRGGVKEARVAYDSIVRTRDSRQRQVTTLQEQQRKTLTKNTECENEKRKVMKERDELRMKQEAPETMEDKNRTLTREKGWKEQLVLLQTAVQRESRRTVVEK